MKKERLTAQEAALYFGQRILMSWKRDKNNPPGSVDTTLDAEILGILANPHLRNYSFKLLLRPWADIKEEEAKELGFGNKEMAIQYLTKLGPRFCLSPSEVKSALAMGFDVYDFFSQGKALDKTTFKM